MSEKTNIPGEHTWWRSKADPSDIRRVEEVKDGTVFTACHEESMERVGRGSCRVESWNDLYRPFVPLETSIGLLFVDLEAKRSDLKLRLDQCGFGGGQDLVGEIRALDDVLSRLAQALAQK